MNDRILLDENKQYCFDFSKVDFVWQVNDIASSVMLNDVDFIAKKQNEILFIEYKNANIQGAQNPNALVAKTKTEKFYKNIAKKYYDSLLILWGCKNNEEELPINYVLIIEHPEIDKRTRKELKLQIMKQLPFKINNEKIKREFISSFEVYNLEEWNLNYTDITIKPNL